MIQNHELLRGELFMQSSQIAIIIAIVVYLLGMLYIGFVSAKSNNDVGDFYLGGRRLGPFVTAMSAEASDMSSYLLMGIPGLAYFSGVADAGWTALGLIVGTYLNWLFTAKKIRRYTERIHAITIPEYFKKRFRDNSNILLLISAAMIIIFFIPYTASGFSACGKLFASVFGVNYQAAMIVSAIVIVGYTMTGGFLAASRTDLIQSIVMTGALFIVLGYGIYQAGGLDAVEQNVSHLQGYLSISFSHSNVTGGEVPYNLFHKITMFCWGLGYFGMPHILLRFMAINNPDKLRLSRRVASIWCLISLCVAVLLGVVGRAMTQEGVLENLLDPSNPTSSSKAETLMVVMAQHISQHGFIVALLAGIILAGILASTMSTADSQMIAASSAVSENILQQAFHIRLSDRAAMVSARVTLLIISFLGIIIAWNPNSSIFSIVSFAWAGFGAAFGPVVIFSLYWKRSNRYGAIAAMIGGGAMVFFWKYVIRPIGGIWDLYELAPAFAVGCILMVVVSKLTQAPEEEIVKEFEDVAAAQKTA